MPQKNPSRLDALYDAFLRKKPRQERSRSVVEAILAAVRERIEDGAEEDLPLHDVAKRAGVGIGSLYDYFTDRRSLLAGVAAKVTEDNLRAFEAVLAETSAMPLEGAVGRIVDFAFETYTTNKRMHRSVLRAANVAGLMPALAASQTAFALSLAAALRARTDVTLADEDLDRAAYVMTHAMMGVIHTAIWEEHAPIPAELLRADVTRLFLSYLTAPPA